MSCGTWFNFVSWPQGGHPKWTTSLKIILYVSLCCLFWVFKCTHSLITSHQVVISASTLYWFFDCFAYGSLLAHCMWVYSLSDTRWTFELHKSFCWKSTEHCKSNLYSIPSLPPSSYVSLMKSVRGTAQYSGSNHWLPNLCSTY